MRKIDVNVVDTGSSLVHLEIYNEGKKIGEYERSQPQNIARKKREIRAAADFLWRTYQNYGEFKVRWNSSRREKCVLVNDEEVTKIPGKFW